MSDTEKKEAKPMTPTKAIATITKIREAAKDKEAEVLAGLSPSDAKRVTAFLSAEVE